MRRSGDKAEEPGGERSVVGDVLGMLTQELGCQSHKIVESARGLQCGCGGDDTDDDEHHVDRYIAWLEPEDKDKDEHANHTVDT